MRFRPRRLLHRLVRPARAGRQVLHAALLARLAAANRLLAQGRPAEAAPLFGQLAGEAEARQQPRRALNLHLRAVEGYALAGNGAAALAQGRAALNMLRQRGALAYAGQLLARIGAVLRQHGLGQEAETLEAEFAGFALAAEPAASAATSPGRLPSQCPRCGAPVRHDEVEWIDESSAACAYCGSVIQTEQSGWPP